jgi:hypothetical protein
MKRVVLLLSDMKGGDETKMKIDIRNGDYVCIKEDKIDKIVQQLLKENKNKLAVRWDSYRNLAFLVIGKDDQNLIILRDSNNHEIHISAKSLILVQIPK